MTVELPKPGLYIVNVTESHTATGAPPSIIEIEEIALDRSLSREAIKDRYLYPAFAHTVVEHGPNLQDIRREKGISE